MKKVMACVDLVPSALNVCNYGAWAAARLAAPLELLHALDHPPEEAPVSDGSGQHDQETSLQASRALDEKRSALAQIHSRELLDRLVLRARAAGLYRVQSRQYQASLAETLVDFQPECSLFVVGQYPPAKPVKPPHHIEQAIGAVKRPVLVVSSRYRYRNPTSFAIAFDGSVKGRKMVQTVARNPLLQGLLCHVVMTGTHSEAAASHLAWARTFLGSAGLIGRVSLVTGEPESSLMTYLKAHAVDLLVMGPCAPTRRRQLIMGSTTTTFLRASLLPVLVLR